MIGREMSKKQNKGIKIEETASKAEIKKAAKAEAKKAKEKAAKKAAANKKPNIFKRFANYLHAVRVELKRVSWPTKQEVINSSLIVIAALVFFGVLIFLVDSGIQPLMSAYSNLGV